MFAPEIFPPLPVLSTHSWPAVRLVELRGYAVVGISAEAYISKVKQETHHPTILVSCADKLHNGRSIMFDYDKIGDEIWDRFKPTKEQTLWYYESLCEAFRQAWPENPLLPDFEAVVGRMRKAVTNDLARQAK